MSENSISEHLKVVAGNPSAEELAAVIAILEAAQQEQKASAKSTKKPVASSWHRNSQQMRGNLQPGRGQWQAAFRAGLD